MKSSFPVSLSQNLPLKLGSERGRCLQKCYEASLVSSKFSPWAAEGFRKGITQRRATDHLRSSDAPLIAKKSLSGKECQ